MTRVKLKTAFTLFTLHLALFTFFPAWALEVPSLRGRVNDLAGLMPAGHMRVLEDQLKRFEEETGHQIAVLTVPSLEGEDIEDFSMRVAEAWKIGQKGFDNGAILLIAKNDRKLRIEVGYGLEGVLPDALASRIIREVIVPRFRANDYAGGIEAGVEAVMKVARGEPLANLPRAPRSSGTQVPPWAQLTIVLFLGLVLLAILARLHILKRSEAWVARGPRRYSGRAVDPLGEDDFFMRGSSFGAGGFGGGGFSGGGGGFGGGGASGSW